MREEIEKERGIERERKESDKERKRESYKYKHLKSINLMSAKDNRLLTNPEYP